MLNPPGLGNADLRDGAGAGSGALSVKRTHSKYAHQQYLRNQRPNYFHERKLFWRHAIDRSRPTILGWLAKPELASGRGIYAKCNLPQNLSAGIGVLGSVHLSDLRNHFALCAGRREWLGAGEGRGHPHAWSSGAL
jgi:hypothetical protein